MDFIVKPIHRNMHSLFRHLTFLLIAMLTATTLSAMADPVYTAILTPQKKGEPTQPTEPPTKHPRLPPHSIPCTVSETTGITTEIPPSQIHSYQISDTDGQIIGIFTHPSPCAQALLTQPSGTYILSIQTDAYIYIGEMDIP